MHVCSACICACSLIFTTIFDSIFDTLSLENIVVNSHAGIIQVYALPLTAIICSLCFFIFGALFGICIQKRLHSSKSLPASNPESLYEDVKPAQPVVAATTSVTPPEMSGNVSYLELSTNSAYTTSANNISEI